MVLTGCEERTFLRAILHWVAWHRPGQVARLESALRDPLEARLWHITACLSDGTRLPFVLFTKPDEPPICLCIDELGD